MMISIPAFLEQERDVYFAAVNTRDGFRSFFSDMFSAEKLNQVIVLKGGPGTGKSTMMKTFASMAANQGLSVEYFLCSSDPNSLDAVLLPNEKIAVLDGTAPHTVEPVCPGVVDSIFDAGRFWERKKLSSHRDSIWKLVCAKKESYGRAYRLLNTAGKLTTEMLYLASIDLQRQKMETAVKRLLNSCLSQGEETSCEHRQISAFNHLGDSELMSLKMQAKVVFAIADLYGSGGIFLQYMKDLSRQKGLGVYESVHPHTTLPDALYFPRNGVLFCLGAESGKKDHVINMQRFVSKENLRAHRNRLRFLDKTTHLLRERSAESFRDAANKHKLLEELYAEAMNFESLTREWSEICEQVLDMA